jgi:1-acyl-sn-glycerol-3-phosphate acyltransferase
MVKRIQKLLFFVLFIISYFSTSLFIILINLFSIERARPELINNISRHAKFALKLFNIKVKKISYMKDIDDNYLLVSNHLSYLDIFVIASQFPACFVTSFEMKETPFLGQLCSIGGCLFVERRSKKGLSNEVKNLTNALDKNMNVVIFPEATSTNGEQLLKFRRPLFQAAVDAGKPVLPLCLNYKKIDQNALNLRNRDLVFWYGDQTFFPHFLNLLTVGQIEVELSILDPFFAEAEMSKTELAEKSFQLVQDHYRPVI